jgi:hypothetical protein
MSGTFRPSYTLPGKVLSAQEIADANERIEKALRASADFEEKITKEKEKQEKLSAKQEKREEKQFENLIKFRVAYRQYLSETTQFGEVRGYGVQGKYGAQQKIPKAKGVNVPEMGREEATQDFKFYDNMFFNPMQQGFNDLNSIIRNQLFGTLDELKNKFGVIGASIIQALQAVIAKLIETAIMAGVLALITGGNFGSIFSFLGSGGSGGQVMSALGGGSPVGKVNTGKIANQMATTGGNRGITVNVVGKLGNDAIYISGQRHLAMQNATRI